jgi:hypothetical protein
MGMALADRGGEKNRRFASQACMGPKFAAFQQVDGINKRQE